MRSTLTDPSHCLPFQSVPLPMLSACQGASAEVAIGVLELANEGVHIENG